MKNEEYVEKWDEDTYPLHEEEIFEYEEDYEEEDDDYPIGYDNIYCNWDLKNYEDTVGFKKNSRKMHSMQSYYSYKSSEKKKQEQRKRAEIKAREKQRQQYYHYKDDEE